MDLDILKNQVANMLIEKNISISISESLSGGLLSATLIECAGISSVFMEGCVAYSNEAKMYRLGVKRETLDSFGAVSHETAREMAIGISNGLNTKIGVSTTGIAGPSGGSEKKPVGLFYIGIYGNGRVKSYEFKAEGDRDKIRRAAVYEALNLIREEILNNSYE